jgi:hypothetical protein
MYVLLTSVWKRTARTYHKAMYAYNSILYKDCLDTHMKKNLHNKVKYHEQKMLG